MTAHSFLWMSRSRRLRPSQSLSRPPYRSPHLRRHLLRHLFPSRFRSQYQSRNRRRFLSQYQSRFPNRHRLTPLCLTTAGRERMGLTAMRAMMKEERMTGRSTLESGFPGDEQTLG